MEWKTINLVVVPQRAPSSNHTVSRGGHAQHIAQMLLYLYINKFTSLQDQTGSGLHTLGIDLPTAHGRRETFCGNLNVYNGK